MKGSKGFHRGVNSSGSQKPPASHRVGVPPWNLLKPRMDSQNEDHEFIGR
jgi:hypothetical protein